MFMKEMYSKKMRKLIFCYINLLELNNQASELLYSINNTELLRWESTYNL